MPGAADFAQHGTRPLDAAIVLGDLAGAVARKPFVLPFSSVFGFAPESLQLTLDTAISQEVGTNPGALSDAGSVRPSRFPARHGAKRHRSMRPVCPLCSFRSVASVDPHPASG